MSTTIKIQLTPEAEQAIRESKTLPFRISAGIAGALDKENQLTVSLIQSKYLSFSKGGPVNPIGCRVISNRLRGSLRASPATIQGNAIVSAIGSNVKYAAAQEFGFEGDETVSPHTRKNVKLQTVFGKRRKIRGGDIGVRSYTRHMKLAGRGFVRRGLADRTANYTASISAAIVTAWKGTTP